MAEPAIQICSRCGAEVAGRGIRWLCPQCGCDNRATRSSLGAPSKTERRRELERKRHLTVVPDPYDRPQTRADCIDGPRPCPFVGCRYHLGIEVTFAGSLKFNFSEEELETLKHSCALDVADQGGASRDDLAPILNVTHTRVGMIEGKALAKLRALVDPEDF